MHLLSSWLGGSFSASRDDVLVGCVLSLVGLGRFLSLVRHGCFLSLGRFFLVRLVAA